MTTYDPALTMRAARDRYFQDNNFGADGGYTSEWVDFKLGPIPLPFRNTAGRVRAVGYHDLHHLVTGYATDVWGEFEISAWELGAGCKDFLVAWQLNLGGLGAGAFTIPRRTFQAFVRGRHTQSLYGRDMGELLDRTVGDVSAEIGTDKPAEATPATAADIALFAGAVVTGVAAGFTSFLALVLAGPAFYLGGKLRGASATPPAATTT